MFSVTIPNYLRSALVVLLIALSSHLQHVPPSVDAAQSVPADTGSDCEERALRGECKRNPEVMLKECAVTCERVGAVRRIQVEKVPDGEPTFYDLGKVIDAKGKEHSLRQYEGYVTIVVTIPRICGLTERYYAALDHLEEIWPWSLEVVAFPFRRAAGTEADDDDEACPGHRVADLSSKRKISVMEEVNVNGPNTHPAFRHFKDLFGIDDGIDESDPMFFLVNPDGSSVEAHYKSNPTHVKDYIRKHMEHDL